MDVRRLGWGCLGGEVGFWKSVDGGLGGGREVVMQELKG